MGEPNQFHSPFAIQPNAFANDPRNAASSQESSNAQVPPSLFSAPSIQGVFGSSSQHADSSGNNIQESSAGQGTSNLFSNPGVQSVFGVPPHNTESGGPKNNTIFGGSAFPKSTATSIFGGALVQNTQPLNLPRNEGSANASQTSFFGQSQMAFGGASSKMTEEVPAAPSGIFGGSQVSSQTIEFKPNPDSLTNPFAARPSMFGGAYPKKDGLKSAFPLSAPDGNSDNLGEATKVPLDMQVSSGPPDKLTSISSGKSAFGRFTNPGIVTSTLSHRNPERSVSSNDVDKKKDLVLGLQAMTQTSAGEPDSLGGENEEVHQRNESTRSTKIIRKHGVFGKAIEDMIKPTGRNQPMEEMRSIIGHPDGDLADITVLKDYFLQFGPVRVRLNEERRYVIATYRTHKDANKAMEGTHVIGGVKYKFFWKNLAKTRRKSTDEIEKQKPVEERRKLIKKAEMEMDDDVREELAALSGIDYLVPEKATSKRKCVLQRNDRIKSRSQMKTDDTGPEVQEDEDKNYDSGKKKISLSSRTEGSKDLKSRTGRVSKETRSDEKSSPRSRISAVERISSKKTASNQLKDEAEESKQEKGEHSVQESAVSTAVASELLETLKQPAFTSEEKLRVLDARDKLIRLKQVKQYDISKAVKTVGTCPDMCPEKERLLRETRRQISQYEMSSSKINEMDPSRMVKQYSRSSADQEEPLPHDLRPPVILTMTMNYLMHTIMNLGDEPGENLGDWYHFLWDRLRGIRKEITQQELCDAHAVSLVEQCARFHIHCGARLVAEDMSVFDDRINTENLTKCLQTLKHMYQDLWMNNSITCSNEPEFITYFLLLNLNNGTIMWEMEQLREEVLKSPEIGFVAAMYNSLSSNNFIRFFRLVRKASYLNSCLCIRYFYQVRAKALSTYIKALAKIRPVQYPLASLVDGLGFENAEHAAAFCNHHGLQVENSSSGSACVILSQETFDNPSFVLPSERAYGLAESKKFGTVGEVVYGGSLPARSFENHVVHQSFDEKGYLRKSAFFAKDQGFLIREEDDNSYVEEVEVTNKQLAPSAPIKAAASVVDDTGDDKKSPSQNSSLSFGSAGNQKLVFPSSFSNSKVFMPPGTPLFKTAFISPLQTSSGMPETMNPNVTQVSGMLEPIRRTVFQNTVSDQARAKIEAEKKAQAELEKTINEGSEVHLQDLLQSSIREATAEAALLEWTAAKEQQHAEEQRRAEEQLQAQEELRKRALETHVDRIASNSLSELMNEIVEQLVSESANDEVKHEEELVKEIKMLSEESLELLIHLVAEELCCNVASEEVKRAQESARQEAVKHRVKQFFYFWLERARRSLHRKRVMKDFPAGVIPLSVKEHAERWGISANVRADVWESCSKGNDKVLDIPELKAMPAYPQITFAELIGIQAVHRYDAVRTKLGLHPTDKLLYKLFVSVPEDFQDPATQLIDWWIRRTFKQNCSMLCDDVKKGVYRIVSGIKVTSEVAVYASLQMVRGPDPLQKQMGLASGTSAVLFTVSPTSNIEASRARLTMLLKSIHKLPAVPLVVAVVSPSEPPLEGLKQLVSELELDQWLSHEAISDYQILHVEEMFDLKYLSERFSMTINYMVMTWTPTAEFTLVCLKNVLRSTFQMFYISIQFNYNSSEVYPRDIDDPRVIIGLCNEWLEHMCNEFVSSYHEARYVCGEEFWPLLHKGAYLPFLNKPRYEQLLQEVIRAVSLPEIEWPPSCEEEFESMLTLYCSWLRPEERKQTLRRLSCLNGLTWPEKIKSIPWVNLIEDWMEARINYIETSVICGTELLCLMRAQNVERLYTYPWWAQSKHIVSYLESNGTGREYEMDVDQTVPIEDASQEENNLTQENAGEPQQSGPSMPVLNQFQKVADCVSELKKVNESLISRLRTALVDDSGASTETRSNETELVRKVEKDVSVVAPNLESLMKNIDLEVKAHQHLQSNISDLLSKALTEDPGKDIGSKSGNNNQNSTISELPLTHMLNDRVVSDESNIDSSKKMGEIMASVNDIVSSLNQKYKILDTTSRFGRISDLKMGFGKIDSCLSPVPSDKLDHSPFVEQSQQRMMERLQDSASKRSKPVPKKSQPTVSDYDSDILSDDRSESTEIRTVSSPSDLDSQSVKSDSDVEDHDFPNSKTRAHSDDSDDENYSRRKKRLHSNDSEDDSYSGSRPRRHRNDSESDNYSGSRVYRRHDDSDNDKNSGYKSWQNDKDSEDEDYSARDKRRHNHDSEDEASYHDSDRSAQASECESADEEEIQTISSDDSREHESPVQDLNLNSANNESHISHSDNPFAVEENEPSLNCHVLDGGLITHNGLVNDNNSDGHLLNLDNVYHQYEYYADDGGVEDPIYPASSRVDVLPAIAQSEVVISDTEVPLTNSDIAVSNCEPEPGSEENNLLLLSQCEPVSEDAAQNVYEVEVDSSNQDCSESVPDCSEDTRRTTSDEEDEDEVDCYDPPNQKLELNTSVHDTNKDLSSEIEEYENLEEEEEEEDEEDEDGEIEAECVEEGEEEVEVEEEVGVDEDEDGEEEEEAEPETEPESEQEDDSDVCEVIDDD